MNTNEMNSSGMYCTTIPISEFMLDKNCFSETLQKFHIFCNAIHRGVRAGSAKKSGKKMINFKFFEKKIYTL